MVRYSWDQLAKLAKELRKEFPPGTRVRLEHMDDVQAPDLGTLGTVLGVDDAASIMVAWDNGSSLSVVYAEDLVSKVD